MKKKKAPLVNLDELNLTVTRMNVSECSELRAPRLVDIMINRPISEEAMKMAVDLKQGKPVTIRVASDKMIMTIRRLYMEDLDRIVKGSDLAARCIEKGTELTFKFVKAK